MSGESSKKAAKRAKKQDEAAMAAAVAQDLAAPLRIRGDDIDLPRGNVSVDPTDNEIMSMFGDPWVESIHPTDDEVMSMLGVPWKDTVGTDIIKQDKLEFDGKIYYARTESVLVQFFIEVSGKSKSENQIELYYGRKGEYMLEVLEKSFPDITILSIDGNSSKSVVHGLEKSVVPSYAFYKDNKFCWAWQADILVFGEGVEVTPERKEELGLNGGIISVPNQEKKVYAPIYHEIVAKLREKIEESIVGQDP